MAELPTLQDYKVKRSQDFPDWLLVTCPREDCGETHLVKAAPWRRKHFSQGKPITGRACPYCFRPSRIPKRIAPA